MGNPYRSGNKYTSAPPRSAGEIEAHLRKQPNGCWLPPLRNSLPFGYLKDERWYITTQGKKNNVKRNAADILYRERYPYSMYAITRGQGLYSYKLHKLCTTPGCANPEHYETVNAKQQRSMEVQIQMDRLMNLLDEALREDQYITFGDESSATAFRAHVYRRRRKWENQGSNLARVYEDIKIVKDKKHPNVLIFTTHSRMYEDILAPYAVRQEDVEDASLEFPTEYEPTKDYAADIIRAAGYAPKSHQPSQAQSARPTYDEVYMKAAAGQTLTPEEQAILEAGPPPEPTQ